MQLAVNYLSWRPVHLSDGMRGWVTCECVTWSDGWWFVIRAGCPHLRGRGVMSPLRAGHKPDAMRRGAQGDQHGGRRIQILCQPFQLVAIKLFARITIQISDSQYLQISPCFTQFSAGWWESVTGLQVIIVILIGLPGVPITSSQHNFNSSHPFPSFDWD